MSHELRTPLNGILGYAQILQRDRTLDHRQIEGVKVIQQCGEHLLALINDILDLARLEAGRLDLYPGDLALRPFLLVIGDIVRVKAEEKELAFHCTLAPDLPERVMADEKRLRQVLLNLLSNAIKFTDHGEVRLAVSLVAPSRLRFEVRDTGIGVAEDQWETIFQPFEQAGDTRQRIGGAGLGLAISRQFVRRMGGEIRISSRVGEGSTFWFELELPIAQADALAAPADAVVSGYTGPRKTVLVVDDLAENRRMMHDMLAPLGFIVLEAVDGREALEKAASAHPDLIVMDTVMPGMDGLEATRRLRGAGEPRHLPVIAVSASASGSDAQGSLAAGADAFLPKPIHLERLLSHVGALLKLQWICNTPPTPAAPEAPPPGPLVPPPLAELTALHELALQGNMRAIRLEAERIAGLDPRYHAFAERLRRLAERYQSKALLRLVEQYLDARPAP
jgi:CheY-like chemotaxis protein